MKKNLLLAFCFLFIGSLNAQTYTSGHTHIVVSDSMSHDSTLCGTMCAIRYNVNIDSSFAGEVLNIVDTSSATIIASFSNTTGVSPWVFDTIAYAQTADGDESIAPVGGYSYSGRTSFKVTCGPDTIRYIIIYDSLWVANPCLYDTVSGRVYIDNNENCIFDSGDYCLNYDNVTLHENLSSSRSVWSLQKGWYLDGYYNLKALRSWLVNYTVNLPSSYAFIFPFSSCYTGPYTYTVLPQGGVDYPLQCTSSIDVQSCALSPGRVRLHRPFYMQPFVSNTGCDSASGQLRMILDSRVAYDSAMSTYPADTVRGDTLIWNYNGLSNLSSGAYWNCFMSDIYLTPATTLAVGDTLCFMVYTNIPSADVNPANNDYSICLPVVYSYDPNEKDVTPKGDGPENFLPPGTDTLTYDIHFQNTGSDVAEDIKIIDTLDSHILPKTLRIIGTSHKMTPKWLAPNIVEFDYNGINLPDSSVNEPSSHGDVRFSVALTPHLEHGTQIRNTGYIYFDLNTPIVTNTTLSTIAIPASVMQVAKTEAVKVYPNPATDYIVVEHLNNGTLTIINMSGSILLEQNITSDKTTIDVSNIAPGVYMLKTISDGNTIITKFTKY